ncbi:MAG: aspartate kinase [Gammaproteobacteria bacterium]|nr:aspartate kinase [Gammaproteobacteria bacterium]
MDKRTLVLKFGGSSVATVQKIVAIAERIITVAANNRCVVVVSAMGDDTDILLDSASTLHPERYPREYDMLLATGEQKTIALLSMALQEKGALARSLTGWQARIKTTAQHRKARIIDIDTKTIKDCWKRDEIPIIAGFQGIHAENITTLGRGGSDLTAVALAAAIYADECQIFTDVDGIYSADPRIVAEAVKISEMNYIAMLELASLGAQVLHNRAVELACKMNIPLRVLSSFIEGDGTLVTHNIKNTPTISGITVEKQQNVINVLYKQDSIHHHNCWKLLEEHNISLSTVHWSRYQDHFYYLSPHQKTKQNRLYRLLKRL